MAAKLYRVIVPVTDLDVAVSFYSKVLGIDGEQVSPGRHYFNCGGTILACYDPIADGDGLGDGWQQHFNQYIYISVENLEAVFALIEAAGGRIEEEIDNKPWGERIFYAKDPSGNPISFVEEKSVFKGSSERNV
jgi:predicted enzyme related to lactoylglutathione lyase